MNNTTHFPQRLSICILLFPTKHANIRILLTAVYGSLIPLFIGANFLLIIGLIKTKRSKFTLSQILSSTLFESDLTFWCGADTIKHLPFMEIPNKLRSSTKRIIRVIPHVYVT